MDKSTIEDFKLIDKNNKLLALQWLHALILFTSLESFKSYQGCVKLCRVNVSIIVGINLCELLDGGITSVCLFQTDQAVLVEVEAEKGFHLMAVDQVRVDLTIGLGDGCGSFHSSPFCWAVFLILFTL